MTAYVNLYKAIKTIREEDEPKNKLLKITFIRKSSEFTQHALKVVEEARGNKNQKNLILLKLKNLLLINC